MTKPSNYEYTKYLHENYFKNHTLKRLSNPGDVSQVFLCAEFRDGDDFDRHFHFYIIIFDRYLTIHGDIGSSMIDPDPPEIDDSDKSVGFLRLDGPYDMIGWLRGSIHSIDYFFEKILDDNLSYQRFSEARFTEWAKNEAFETELESFICDHEDWKLTVDINLAKKRKSNDSIKKYQNSIIFTEDYINELIEMSQQENNAFEDIYHSLNAKGFNVGEIAKYWFEPSKRAWLRYFAIKKFVELYEAELEVKNEN